MNICVLNACEAEDAFALRHEVFVTEQQVPPEIEIDEEDPHAWHILAIQGDEAVGCARVIIHGTDAHIGRLAVKRTCRGQGIGAEICRFIISYCREQGCTYLWLHSQTHAIAFYKKLGFAPEGDVFYEAGMPHVRMSLVTAEGTDEDHQFD